MKAISLSPSLNDIQPELMLTADMYRGIFARMVLYRILRAVITGTFRCIFLSSVSQKFLIGCIARWPVVGLGITCHV